MSEIIRPWLDDAVGCFAALMVEWDQWAVAVFKCEHGEYRGTSAGQADMLQAVRKAYRKFLVNHGAYHAHLVDRRVITGEALSGSVG